MWALEELTIQVINDWGINMYHEFKGDISKIESIVQINAYRIIQEIINNVKKHSRAKNINVSISCNKEILGIVIEDDGVGFDFKK